ncbi:hypothetical protein AB836_00445 [Rickettsiales bacterium (ex Bugula neritina AB1)]|nr:hypothetical protein AB836_00445 [Rickettsiales bacterium (ex Bugula neritina AB1)]
MDLEKIKKDFEEILIDTQQKVALILSDKVTKELFENIKFQDKKIKQTCLIEVVNKKKIIFQPTSNKVNIKNLLEFLEKNHQNYFFKIVDKSIEGELLNFEENKLLGKKKAKQQIEEAKIYYRTNRQKYFNYVKKNIKSDSEKKTLEKSFDKSLQEYQLKLDMLLK